MLFLLVDHEAVGEEGLYHEVHVGLEVCIALPAQLQRHVEHHVAGPLVPQLELQVVVLARRSGTFLNMSSVRLLLLKYSEDSPTIKSQGLTWPMLLTMGQISSSNSVSAG